MRGNISGYSWVVSSGTYWFLSVTVELKRNELAPEEGTHERISCFTQKHFILRKQRRVQKENCTFWITEPAITFSSLGFCFKTFFSHYWHKTHSYQYCIQSWCLLEDLFAFDQAIILSSLKVSVRYCKSYLTLICFCPSQTGLKASFFCFFVQSLQWSFCLLYLAKVTFSFLAWI